MRLYKIRKYNNATKKFIDNEYDEVVMDDAIRMLEEDKGYHMRINPLDEYILFGDCDGFRKEVNGEYVYDFNIFAAMLIEFMKNEISDEDISYTENESKKGSYHYSIPKIYGKCKDIKKFQERFFKKNEKIFKYVDDNNKNVKVVDTGIYGDKWFRLPNQTKEGVKGTKHKIKRGIMRDFLVNDIPGNAKNINDIKTADENVYNNVEYELVKNKGIYNDVNEEVLDVELLDKEEVRYILSKINRSRCDEYDTWIKVGTILKNHSINNELLDEWIKWSKQSNKYKENECDKMWKGFKKMRNGLKVGTLLKILKEDNMEEFENVKKRLKIRNIVCNSKKHFPKNKLDINKILTNENFHYVGLADTYCPIFEGEHNGSNCYIECYKNGHVTMKCYCDCCKGLVYPKDKSITMSRADTNYLFNVTQNINININEDVGINEDIIKIPLNSIIFEDSILNELIIKSLVGTESSISKVLHYLYKNRFNYAQENNKWYEFKNHRWCISDELYILLSDDMCKYYNIVIEFIKKLNLDKNEKKYAIKEVNKIKKILETRTSIKNIIEMAGYRFKKEKENFYNELDTTPYLICFNNGVYDLNTMEFRDGTPEDMMSMTCGYDYCHEYSKESVNLNNFLEDIFPIKEDREYFLTYLSTGLTGLNILEQFTILSGGGRNGKSKFSDLISLTFGDYCAKPKCKLLTGSRPDENSPEPGLLSLKKKRVIIASEPEIGDKLNTGFIKFITGNDETRLRECHKNEIILFKANFITMLICNDIPEVDDMGNAFTKRLRCINFPTEFVSDPKFPHQKKIDKTIQEKMIYWRNDFLLILLEYFKIYKKTKDVVPSKNVLKYTTDYNEEVDKYHIFLEEATEESSEHLSNAILFDTFKIWHKQKYPAEKIPNNRDFINGIKKHKNIEKGVKINGKTTTGIKYLKLTE